MPVATLDAPAVAQRTVADKHLTFVLGNESYGIKVLKIREIIRHTDITAVAQMPAYIKGVINLRGKIIPVVDLRIKFGLAAAEATKRRCIVVVQVTSISGATISAGILVDDVEEVINIAANDIEEPPDFGSQMSTVCILGMAKIKGRVKALLDIDRVVSGDTLPHLAMVATLTSQH
ncbi:MAG: purine-binding chemotaxis protein CheW [Verrucomicrobia bacterium]|nr:purine-binding chemotaxis protein CheW [Verrucomicrobiota bacterium]